MSAVSQLDREIQRRHLLKHPFYQAWSQGTLSREVLQDYASQYYHFESRFPRYVAETYAHLEDPRDRRVLLENLTDEEGREPTHPELWLRFTRALGLPRGKVVSGPVAPQTRKLLETYEHLTHDGSAVEGLSALYAYESIFPEVATEKSRGLKAFYGLRAPGAHEFFRVHAEADVEHSAAERGVLARALQHNPASLPAAQRATRRTVGSWWDFLSAFPAA